MSIKPYWVDTPLANRNYSEDFDEEELILHLYYLVQMQIANDRPEQNLWLQSAAGTQQYMYWSITQLILKHKFIVAFVLFCIALVDTVYLMQYNECLSQIPQSPQIHVYVNAVPTPADSSPHMQIEHVDDKGLNERSETNFGIYAFIYSTLIFYVIFSTG